MLETVTPYWLPLAALAVAAALYVIAPWLTSTGRSPEDTHGQILLLRLVVVAFGILQIADILLHETLDTYYNRLLLRSSLTILSVLVALIVFNASNRSFDAKFGRKRRIDGKDVPVASYHSRMASGLFLVLLITLLTYLLIEIWGLESLLERTGFIGILAAFIVLTSTIWLPDIMYGLVLLNSSMAEEGDTIRVPDHDSIFIVNRLTPFYAILLDVDSNHRVLIRNSALVRQSLENFSKRASIDGLRRQVEIRLSYPVSKLGAAGATDLFEQVDLLVTAAWERAAADPGLAINDNEPFRWSLLETGDSALKFVLFYHLKALPDTKITEKVRAHVRLTAHGIVRLIFEEAMARGVSLATPSLVSLIPPTNDPAK